MLCRHSQLVGPCEQPEINAFLDDHYPTSNDSSFGRFYVVKRDEDIPTPAAEGWKGRNKAFVAEMAPFMEEMTEACETIAVRLLFFSFPVFTVRSVSLGSLTSS